MKNIVLLGSTGSIGSQTLDVIEQNPGLGRICALAARGSRLDLLEKQIRKYRPSIAVVYEEAAYRKLRQRLTGVSTRLLWGMQGLLEAVSMEEAELVVTALVGMIGLEPTVRAIQCGKDIALANKETLVCAGELIMKLARQEGVAILPVDSEHGAIFQCLDGKPASSVSSIILTASGGPFRGKKRDDLRAITREEALRHPNWVMGQKITIDSATLFNKGLEMIEARWLFDKRPEQIRVVVHPQSIVHSMVEFTDGSILAQMATPDMRLPIEAAIAYPSRGGRVAPPLELIHCPPLTFEAVDEETFPAVALARHAMERGGLCPAVLNAANERAVAEFLQGRIGFLDIYCRVEAALSAFERYAGGCDEYSLEDVLDVVSWVESFWKAGDSH